MLLLLLGAAQAAAQSWEGRGGCLFLLWNLTLPGVGVAVEAPFPADPAGSPGG